MHSLEGFTNQIKKMNFKKTLSELRLYICNRWIANIPSHTIRIFFYTRFMGFEIGKGSSIHLGCKFNCAKNFSIGRNSTINQDCWIDNRGGINIGDNVSISPYVKLITADHDVNHPSCIGRNREIIIENHVFIGSDAMILGGVEMKSGSVLGSKSLLTKSTEPFGIYFGIPAKIKSNRPNDLNYSGSFKRWFH